MQLRWRMVWPVGPLTHHSDHIVDFATGSDWNDLPVSRMFSTYRSRRGRGRWPSFEHTVNDILAELRCALSFECTREIDIRQADRLWFECVA